MFSILFLNAYILMAMAIENIDNTDINIVSSVTTSIRYVFPKSEDHDTRSFVNKKYNKGLSIHNLVNKRYKRSVSESDINPDDLALYQLKDVLSNYLSKEGKEFDKEEASSSLGVNFSKSNRIEKRGTNKESEEPKWHNWTKWSACSVTCGKGREIRWRHCKENCKEVEIEMEEKACQLPACPQKLFGIIKL